MAAAYCSLLLCCLSQDCGDGIVPVKVSVLKYHHKVYHFPADNDDDTSTLVDNLADESEQT